jgi:hypothetical protein
MMRVVIHVEIDVPPPGALYGVGRRLNREEVHDRCIRFESGDAPAAAHHVRHTIAGRDRYLVGDRRNSDVGADPVGTIRVVGFGARGYVLKLRRSQFCRKAITAALHGIG